MPESIEQFGQRIKAKHPEYSDMSDIEVGQKVLEKYPEYSDMVEKGPLDPYGRPIAREESIRETYPSEKFARYAEPISQFGGMFARKTGIGAGLAGAATMGAEIARQGIQAIGSEPGTPTTMLESGKRIGQAFGRGALGEVAGRGIIAGGGAALSKMAPTLQKTGAQAVRVATGVPEREALAVIKDPSLLSRAPSVKQAGKMYEEAINKGVPYQIKSAGEGSRIAFGKTMLSPEATIDKFDELLPAMESGKLDLQSALALRQNASHIVAKGKDDWFVSPLRETIEKTDEYIEKRLLDFPAAKQAYREAKIAEEFNSWLPLNKNLSPNVLRTAGALTYAAHGASEGRIVPMLMALGVSPKIWGYGLRAGQKAGKAIGATAKAGTRLGTQSISGQVFPSSSTEELRRKYMERR